MENNVKPKRKRSRFFEIWKRFKKNPLAMIGLVILTLMVILAATAGIIAPPSEDGLPAYMVQNRRNALQFPSSEHIMGTDQLGRDVFHRIAHGSRISLSVGLVVIGIGLTFGVSLGAIAGFYGGLVDNIFMRIIDIILAMPNIMLAITIAAMLGPGMMNVMIAVGVGAIPVYARTVRALVLTYKEQEFVEAAKAAGANDFRLIRRHILPNCISPLIVEASMGMAGGIMAAAALSFIGIGLQAPIPEWGAMLAEGRGFLLSGFWYLTVFPGVMIALIIFSLNMMGDGLRDALDPRLRSGGFSKKRFRRMQLMKAAAQTESGEGQ